MRGHTDRPEYLPSFHNKNDWKLYSDYDCRDTPVQCLKNTFCAAEDELTLK